MIHRVPLHLVPDVWPALESYAERAAHYHPFLDPESMFVLLMNGYATLFLSTDDHGIEGFAMVEVIRFPKATAGNVVAAGGRHGFLKTLRGEMLAEMERWSAEHGATLFSVTGRPGWLRVTRRLGFAAELTSTAWRPINGQQGRGTNH